MEKSSMDDFLVPAAEVPQQMREQYAVVVRLPVQWGDQDSFGHVNNTVYFRWFESARIAFMHRLGLFSGEGSDQPHRDQPHYDQTRGNVPDDKPMSTQKLGLILAAINCNFRRMVHFPDMVFVGAKISRFGRTSMVMDHAAYSQTQGIIIADGSSTVVMFDYAAQIPVPVPEEIRQAVTKL